MASGESVHTTNELLTNVNSLYAYGGADCPEYGMRGIRKAIELINDINYPPVKSRGKHHVIVLTDASAKDDHLYTQVISEATANANITIHMFFSGTGCSGSFGNYKNVAASTGGTTVNQINAGGFDQFAKYIRSRLGEETGEETGKAQCHTFDIGTFVIKFTVLFRVLQPTLTVTVTKPDASTQSITITGDYATYEETSPQAGTYEACVAHGTFTQSVSTEESVNMAIDFLERSGMDLLPTAIPPVLCKLAVSE